MRAICRVLRKYSMIAGCLLVALPASVAQKGPAVSPAATRSILEGQAHELEARGRPDMAVQLWQQILLSDPKNQEAMEGLARDYKLIGNMQKADDALSRLRSAYPNDPKIAQIEALASTRVESDQLRQAGELARQGKNEDAMRVYRKLYGDHPPDGDIALAYYQTLYGTPGGKAAAIAGMRALADRNPGDSRYPIQLGTMLTYNPDTRAEGIRLLQQHSDDPTAQRALRQALIWDAANPAAAGELAAYLHDHPQDAEIAKLLKQDQEQLAKMNSGIARTPAEVAAFAALNAHKLDDAEARFNAILREQPNNGRAAAGMGFLRMQQKNFGAAIAYLNQAEQDGFKDRTVEDALDTSRFWYTMGEATQAFNAGQFDVAAAKYREALVMKPASPEALNGLGGLFIVEKQYSSAADVYQQLVRIQPANADGWRGLFLAYAQDGESDKALNVQAHFPDAVKTAMEHDPEYLSALANIYQAQGRTAEAQRVLTLALSLPIPSNGAALETGTRLQYAGILMALQHYDRAAALYAEILGSDPNNLSAWEGLISAHHSLDQDAQAMADIHRMPSAAYESALKDSAFLALLGSIYQQANQLDVAQSLLERAVRAQQTPGGQASVQIQLQLAAIYLERNDTTRAYALYRQILTAHPGRPDAWKGLISTLLATNHDQQALEEMAMIPAPARKQLDNDVDFMQAEASAYAATGDIRHAVQYMNEVNAHYARLKMEPPANVAVQTAWLLYNTHSDRALYPALMRLGARRDLTVAERETVQDIWANWSVRRAGEAMDNSDPQNALEILDAALEAFPDNMTVRKAVAGGYVQVGHAKQAEAIYKTIPLQDASAADFAGAIGAALAANDKTQAEAWLRQALARYTSDPAVLALAARYEQARGDNQRAAAYWRASLAAMPPSSPTDRLAHELDYPAQDLKAHRAATAADLEKLLNPDNEPFAKTTKLPPLPAYGPDPDAGSAPVVLPSSGPDQQTAPQPAPQPAQQTEPAGVPPASRLELPATLAAGPAAKPAAWIADQSAVRYLRAGTAPDGDASLQLRNAVFHPIAARGRMVPAPAIEQRAQGAEFAGRPQLLLAQYTPSAQEAATGAYSSPKAQTAQPAQAPQVPPAPPAAAPVKKKRRRRKKAAADQGIPAPPPATPPTAPVPAPGNSEPAAPNTQPQSIPEPAPQTAPATSNPGLTDEELEQRNLPPLTGPWVRVQREQRPLSPREEAERQLQAIESGYSGWLGGTGLLNYRSGNLGYDHLSALEAPFEASVPLGYSARFTIVAKPVFLDSGQATGSAVISVDESTTAGTTLTTIPEPIGTDTNTSGSATTGPGIPAQQNAAGIGGEAQLAFPHLSIAAGYTPAGFLVATFTARAYWRPGNGPFTFSFDRDSVKDSQLSYAGLRDPAGNSLGTLGTIWGGVVYNYGRMQFSRGDAQSGYYVGAGGQYLSGYNVETNTRIEGSGGAYWRVYTAPEYGNLSIGTNFFGMHYANNQDAFTFGMGGYFSPQSYFLANIPFTWVGHYQTHWHYNILGGIGVQAFQEDETPLWPLAGQKALETAENNPMLPALTSVGPNYDLRSNVAYQIGPHWFAGGYFGANNTRNYASSSVGFYVRFMFRGQPSEATSPTGIFPTDGLRPFTVP
jgi:cellulose synthase operon protein C